MPLNPPPVIQTSLGLITQPLKRSDMTQIAQLTYAVLVSVAPTPTVAQDTIDDFQDNFNAQLHMSFDTEVSILPPSIKLGQGTTTPLEAVAAGAAVSGGQSASFPPPQVAVIAKKLTGLGGRPNRGRTYFPYLGSSADIAENGSLSGSLISGVNGVLATFLTQLITDGTPMVIANKTYNTPLPPHYVTFVNAGPFVTSYTVEPLVATQRRRLGR